MILIRSIYNNVSKQGLGNRLFQYCWARNIAETKGYALISDPIEGFPETYNHVPGEVVKQFVVSTPEATQMFDMNAIYNHQGGIVIAGYSQRYEHYLSIKDNIKQWMRIENEEKYETPDENDIVINVRLGDYVPLGWDLPMEYYLNVLKTETYNKAIVITDEPMHPTLEILKSHGCIIKDNSHHGHNKFIADFVYVKHANKTIIANSTFSWWASFLGEGKVYFPCLKFPWISNPGPNDVDLRVFDEDRYNFIYGVK